jgi:uncharacterized protein with von Willebrand factor type A (vWA) domain
VAIHFSTICGLLGRALVHAHTQPVHPFAKMTAAMDGSSDDDNAAISDLNNEFFYTHFFEDWSD